MRIVITSLALLALASCSSPLEPRLPPRLEWFEPASGPRGTLVTIHGHDFSKGAVPAEVSIGDEHAEVVSRSDTTIVARVPGRAFTAKLAVTNGSGTSVSPGRFVVTFSPGSVYLVSMVLDKLPIDRMSRLRVAETDTFMTFVDRDVYGVSVYRVREVGASPGGGPSIQIQWDVPADAGYDHRSLEIVVDTSARTLSRVRYIAHQQSAWATPDRSGHIARSDTVILHDVPYTPQENGSATVWITSGNLPPYLEKAARSDEYLMKDFREGTYREDLMDVVRTYPDDPGVRFEISLE
jgi:hypothetical protein